MGSIAVSTGAFLGGIFIGVAGASIIKRDARPPSNTNVSPNVSPNTTLDLRNDLGGILLDGHHPGPIADFLRQVAYISSYDRSKRHPHWTAEHITSASLLPPADGSKGDRKNSVFREDVRIPELFRSKNADYFRSGYGKSRCFEAAMISCIFLDLDRGHMVPAADCKSSQQAMDDTFYLSNIAPQVGEGFNRDYWAHMEDFVRRLTTEFADLYVFTIPLYLPRQASDGKWRISYEVIGDPPSIHVPTHFAKVIYGREKPRPTPSLPLNRAPEPLPAGGQSTPTLMASVGLNPSQNWSAIGAFVTPNAVIPNEAPLRSFAVPVDAVERAAGLELFPSALKASTRPLCDMVDCNIIVRDFSNRNKNRLGSSPTSSPK